MCVNKIQKLFKLVLFVLLSPFWEMAKFAPLATCKNLETGIHASLDSNCHYFQNLQPIFLCVQNIFKIFKITSISISISNIYIFNPISIVMKVAL